MFSGTAGRLIDPLVFSALAVLSLARLLTPAASVLMGSFFGETLIERHGGIWLSRGEDVEEVVVELRSTAGVIEANVFGKVLKLFRNGIEDSTLWMGRSIAEGLEAR